MTRRLAGTLVVALTALAAGGPAAADDDASSAAVPRKEVGPLVDAVFEHELGFCHDPSFVLAPDERRWCALVPPGSARCSALALACRREAAAPARHERSRAVAIPGFGNAVAVLFWVLVGLGVLLVLGRAIQAARAVRRARGDAPEATLDEAAEAREADAEPLRTVETDVERLLAEARAAAAAGDFRAAIEAAYAAMLRKLEGSGVVRVEPDRTNGDHVREVARRLPALRARVAAVVGEVEEVQFGGAPPDEARFRAVSDRVRGVVGERLAPLAALLVAVTLGATLAGCGLARARREQSPSGRGAVMAFLQRYGFDARERLLSLDRLDKAPKQLILLPEANVDAEAWTALHRFVLDGGTLLVAGVAPEVPTWIEARSAPLPDSAPGTLEVASDQAESYGRIRGAVPPTRELVLPADKRVQTRDDDDDDDDDESPTSRPLVIRRGGSVYAAEQTLGDGRILVLADDGLFQNASLLVPDNARLLAELLREGGRRIDVAGDFTGLVAPNPVASVGRGELAPALLQLAALALIFFACRGAHFGRPLDPRPASRRAFVEHVRALGLIYGRARASRHALESYGGYALERLRERLHLGGRKSLQGVAEAVAARTGRPFAEVLRPLVEAHPGAPGGKPAPFAPEDLATLREIATLLAATGGSGERTRRRRSL